MTIWQLGAVNVCQLKECLLLSMPCRGLMFIYSKANFN